MANTKKLTPEERKKAKRVAREALKVTFRKLTKEQRKEYEKKTKGGVKGFILGTNEENE